MTRQPSPSRESPSSWVAFKDLARRQYERGDYDGALTSYTSALNPDLRCPSSEQQIILSNLVACRLKIGGPAQARAAIESSKQCIALNPQWAKGHVRLASAYIALGGHSNDACNELQRAISIDPGNSTARVMLLRELRRDHATASARNNGSNTAADASGPENNNARTDFDESPSASSQQQQQQHAVDDSLSWSERLQWHLARVTSWYHSQSDDVKTICKIVAVVLVLYVAFGGRFGLEGNSRQTGNYGSNNVYDQYRRHGSTQSSYPYSDNHGRDNRGSSSHRRTSHRDDSYRDDYHQDDNYYSSRQSNSSWGSFNPMDGGLPSMVLLGGAMYAGHRMGINPFQTMMFLNMVGGGRGRMRPRGGFGMGGFGRGMGGFGGGMGGRRGMGYGRGRF